MNGKWILKDVNSGNDKKGYSGFQLLEIKDSIAEFYTNFLLEKKKLALKVLDDKMVTAENVEFAKYKAVNDNHLKLFID